MSEVWAFDVDGTLVDSMSATSLRPGAMTALQGLREQGHRLVLWSAGGRAHCEGVIARHGLNDLFEACYDSRSSSTAGCRRGTCQSSTSRTSWLTTAPSKRRCTSAWSLCRPT